LGENIGVRYRPSIMRLYLLQDFWKRAIIVLAELTTYSVIYRWWKTNQSCRNLKIMSSPRLPPEHFHCHCIKHHSKSPFSLSIGNLYRFLNQYRLFTRITYMYTSNIVQLLHCHPIHTVTKTKGRKEGKSMNLSVFCPSHITWDGCNHRNWSENDVPFSSFH